MLCTCPNPKVVTSHPVKIWSKNNNQNGQLSTCLRGCIKRRTATNQSLCVITEPLWTWQWFTIQVGRREQNQQRKQQQRPSVRGMQIHEAEHVRWLMLKAQRNAHVFMRSGLCAELWGVGVRVEGVTSCLLTLNMSARRDSVFWNARQNHQPRTAGRDITGRTSVAKSSPLNVQFRIQLLTIYVLTSLRFRASSNVIQPFVVLIKAKRFIQVKSAKYPGWNNNMHTVWTFNLWCTEW